MIVDDKVNRFETSFGHNPVSIDLANKVTTPASLLNIAQAGDLFSTGKDFGDGLRGLGFAQTFAGATANGVDPTSIAGTITNIVSGWDWHEWVLALLAGYSVYKFAASTVGGVRRSIRKSGAEREGKRKRLASAKRKYQEAREETGFLGGLFGA